MSVSLKTDLFRADYLQVGRATLAFGKLHIVLIRKLFSQKNKPGQSLDQPGLFKAVSA